MTTRIRAFICAALCALAWGMPAHAVQVLEEKIHKNWASYVLKEGDAAMSGMATQAADKSSYLMLDFYPQNCGVGVAKLTIPFDEPVSDDVPRTLRGSLRIDTNAIVDVVFNLAPKENAIVLTIDGVYGERLFRAALHGREIRFKIDLPGAEPLYTRYSLMGFTAAYERAQNYCSLIKDRTARSRDENYFPSKPRPKQRQSPSKNDESAYF